MEAAALRDFGDWLSPIIVKELRQGMRTRLFSTAFIVLQGLMVLCMIVGFSENSSTEGITAFFWAFVGFTLMLVMPLRGFGALSNEVKLNTMDLIALTRLSPWRIAFGKWAALFSQSLLLSTAVLPYVVLRYFLGGINLVGELIFLGMALLMSGLLSAAMVCFSAFPNFLVRALCALGACVGAFFLIGGFIAAGQMSPSGIPFAASPDYGWIYLAIISLTIFLGYYFLDMGATRIAPEAVNYSTRRRLLSILVLGILLSLPLFLIGTVEEEIVYVLSIWLLSWFAFDALTETPSGVKSLHLPFLRRGPPGRIAQLFLTPGWLSGGFYVILLSGMLFGAAQLYDGLGDTLIDRATIHISLAGAHLFPLLIVHLFFAVGARNLLPAYFFVQAGTALIATFITIVEDLSNMDAILWAGSPLPLVSLIMTADNGGYGLPLLILSSTTLAICIAVNLWRGAPHISDMNRASRWYRKHKTQTAPA